MSTLNPCSSRPGLSLAETGRLGARAPLLGSRINLRALPPTEGTERLAAYPLTLSLGRNSLAVLFRFGALVCSGPGGAEQPGLLERLFLRGH